MTIRGYPFMARCLILAPVTGWASVGLAPITSMHSVWPMSLMELVAAPVPNVRCNPRAVGEWQTRAQPSILLVPTTARMNFCMR